MESNTFFTSDNHFGHTNIRKFSPDTREGVDTKDMDRIMIERWNAVVQPSSTVYCLGDFSFYKDVMITDDILGRLNGRIHLIRGNHDYNFKGYGAEDRWGHRLESIRDYREIVIDGIKICLSHYPMVEWNGMHRGSFHLFGHVHGSLPDQPFRSMDAGIDTRKGMTPYTWKEIHDILIAKPIKPHHGKVQE